MSSYASGYPSAGTEDSNDLPSGQAGLQDEDAAFGGVDLYDRDDKPEDLLPGLTAELEKELIELVTQLEQESFPVWRFL
jgi:hypothetical protein